MPSTTAATTVTQIVVVVLSHQRLTTLPRSPFTGGTKKFLLHAPS